MSPSASWYKVTTATVLQIAEDARTCLTPAQDRNERSESMHAAPGRTLRERLAHSRACVGAYYAP